MEIKLVKRNEPIQDNPHKGVVKTSVVTMTNNTLLRTVVSEMCVLGPAVG